MPPKFYKYFNDSHQNSQALYFLRPTKRFRETFPVCISNQIWRCVGIEHAYKNMLIKAPKFIRIRLCLDSFGPFPPQNRDSKLNP